jgi:hypothetical protein
MGGRVRDPEATRGTRTSIRSLGVAAADPVAASAAPEIEDDDYEPAIDFPAAAEQRPRAQRDGTKKLSRVSRRHRARNVAHREVGNHERLALLREYEITGRRLRELLEQVYACTEAVGRTDALARRRDPDLLEDGLTSDGRPLREALDHELMMVAEVIRLAANNSAFIPVSSDSVEVTTAAVIVDEHNASVYQAVREVFKIPSAEVSDSHQRKSVQRAIKRRRK